MSAACYLFPLAKYIPHMMFSPCGLQGGAFAPPFPGVRWLKYDDTLEAIDQIGDETRTVIQDNIINNDGTGGGVVLDSTFSLTKWAVGFRISNYIYNARSWTVGGGSNKAILLSFDGMLDFRDSSSVHLVWDGSGDTVLTDTNKSDSTVFMYSDGVNIYAYLNGVYKGYITPNTTSLELDHIDENWENNNI